MDDPSTKNIERGDHLKMAHALAGTAILRGVFLILVNLYPGLKLGVGTPHQVDEVDVG